MPRPHMYRFQYQKKIWGDVKKFLRKKNVFVQKCDEIRRFDGNA